MFRKMTKPQYPPRLWALVGFPGSGKSTFATQMRGPILAIDADQRFAEVLGLASERDVYELSEVAGDNTDPGKIAALLGEGMPGAEVATVVIDSLTAIIAPLVTRAVRANDAGEHKNRMSAFRDKALAMRTLQDAVSKWGTDTLWIYHLQRGRDAQAEAQITATVSRTELARLTRSLNLQIEVIQEGDQRGVKVTWARRGRAFPMVPILWDDTDAWRGMPERIEVAVYDGLVAEEEEEIASAAPEIFPSPAKAIAWGYEQGAFNALQHARNAYDKLKREAQPQTAAAMRDLWVSEVKRRLEEAGQ